MPRYQLVGPILHDKIYVVEDITKAIEYAIRELREAGHNNVNEIVLMNVDNYEIYKFARKSKQPNTEPSKIEQNEPTTQQLLNKINLLESRISMMEQTIREHKPDGPIIPAPEPVHDMQHESTILPQHEKLSHKSENCAIM